ncbi:MAG: DUF4344 domain-containing metallopeptidase [Cyanobacteria bacterium P01_G01_bin.49]
MKSIFLKFVSYVLIGLLVVVGLWMQKITTRFQTSDIYGTDSSSQNQLNPSEVLFSHTSSKQSETPTFTVVYTPAKTQRGKEIQGLLQRTQTYEQLTRSLNQVLFLPVPLTVNQAECGMANAFYSPADRQIIMCYELTDHFLNFYASRTGPNVPPTEISTVGALSFIFLHELGHAVVDVLDVPILGREEDAVDRFATTILSKTAIGHVAAQAAAIWFEAGARQQDYRNIPYWNEHSLNIQRFFDIVCLLYGSSPQTYADLMQRLNISERRAMRCQKEYAEVWENWMKILGPHVRPLPETLF